MMRTQSSRTVVSDFNALEHEHAIKWFVKKYGLDRADAETLVNMPDDRREAILAKHDQWRESVGLPAANSPLSRGKLRDMIRGKSVREAPVVADFDTLDDLIAHAKREGGATHVSNPSGVASEAKIYFPLKSGGYAEASVWCKEGYWHAQAPSVRIRVAKLPPTAKPIAILRRRVAEAPTVTTRRGRNQYIPAEDLRQGDVILEPEGELTVTSDPEQIEGTKGGYRVVYIQFQGTLNGQSKVFRFPYESSVRILARPGRTKETPTVASDGNDAYRAEIAGAKHAEDQIQSDYFRDWVHDQLLEAEQMRKRDPSSVIPFDAKRVAKRMLQQLSWDTKHGLRSDEIFKMVGSDDGDTRATIRAFFEGFDAKLREDDVVNWLADEVSMHRLNDLRHIGSLRTSKGKKRPKAKRSAKRRR